MGYYVVLSLTDRYIYDEGFLNYIRDVESVSDRY